MGESNTFGDEEGVKLLHNASFHDGIYESHFFGQLCGSERILDGDVFLVIVEQRLGGGKCWLGKIGKRITDDHSVGHGQEY